MQQFKAFLDERRIALIQRLAGDDPRKALRIYAIAIFLMGLVAGCLLMVLAQPFGVLLLVLSAGAVGYLLRAFVSHRRREAFRRGQR